MGARLGSTAADYFPSRTQTTAGFLLAAPLTYLRVEPFDIDNSITARASTITTSVSQQTAQQFSIVIGESPRMAPPACIQTAVARLNNLLRFRTPGWDSYGALPVAQSAVVGALSFLLSTLDSTKPWPSIVPTTRGGVQLEWHRLNRDLEIEVRPDRSLYVFFEDEETGESFEDALVAGSPQLERFVELATAESR